jgi:hypothetical protein
MNTGGTDETKGSQCVRVINHLRKAGGLTPLDARSLFLCDRLASRIFTLREEGWDIKTEMITTSTGKRVALYTLADPNQSEPEPSVKLRRKTLSDIEKQIEKMPGGVDWKSGARWVINQIRNK